MMLHQILIKYVGVNTKLILSHVILITQLTFFQYQNSYKFCTPNIENTNCIKLNHPNLII
jgi:hypothetical protein